MTVADTMTAYLVALEQVVADERALLRCLRALILLHHPRTWGEA